MDLADAQGAVLEPLFRPQRRVDGRGRPWQNTRAVLNGVLWILRTGAPWHDLPRRYPPYQTCHRRFQQCRRSGLLTRLLQKSAEDLRDRGKLDLSESFIDASFSSAKKRGSAIGPTYRSKDSKIMAISDGHVLPIAVHAASASAHETKPVEATLERRLLRETPERLIGDRAYDSDPLDARMRQRFGVEFVAPHTSMRCRKATQDGRVLRHVVIRSEYCPENFLGMVQHACVLILLRYL